MKTADEMTKVELLESLIAWVESFGDDWPILEGDTDDPGREYYLKKEYILEHDMWPWMRPIIERAVPSYDEGLDSRSILAAALDLPHMHVVRDNEQTLPWLQRLLLRAKTDAGFDKPSSKQGEELSPERRGALRCLRRVVRGEYHQHPLFPIEMGSWLVSAGIISGWHTPPEVWNDGETVMVPRDLIFEDRLQEVLDADAAEPEELPAGSNVSIHQAVEKALLTHGDSAGDIYRAVKAELGLRGSQKLRMRVAAEIRKQRGVPKAEPEHTPAGAPMVAEDTQLLRPKPSSQEEEESRGWVRIIALHPNATIQFRHPTPDDQDAMSKAERLSDLERAAVLAGVYKVLEVHSAPRFEGGAWITLIGHLGLGVVTAIHGVRVSAVRAVQELKPQPDAPQQQPWTDGDDVGQSALESAYTCHPTIADRWDNEEDCDQQRPDVDMSDPRLIHRGPSKRWVTSLKWDE